MLKTWQKCERDITYISHHRSTNFCVVVVFDVLSIPDIIISEITFKLKVNGNRP